MFRNPLVRTALLAFVASTVAASAPAAERLRPASALPENQQILVSDATARAFDHVRAARGEIGERESYAARKELAQASTLLARARAASPATRVQREISALQIRLEDRTTPVQPSEFEPVFAALDAAGDGAAYDPTRRHVERARFYRNDPDQAGRELVAAAARIPFGEIDGPLAAADADVAVAMIELYVGELKAADETLGLAERSTQAAVQIASGTAEATLPDVAAPPPPETQPQAAPEAVEEAQPETVPETRPQAVEEEQPEPAESVIPAPSEFQEPQGETPAEPGASEAAPAPPGA